MLAFRYDPFGPEAFPIGGSPFRVRGLAYMALRHYADHKLPGGFGAVVDGLEGDPFAAYYQQLFIAAGDYDASPLLRLFRRICDLRGREIGAFIAARSRASAAQDSTGMWKPLLKASSPMEMAKRLPLAFNRYFEPCAASVVDIRQDSFSGELGVVPEAMSGLYCQSTVGFVTGCLELAGARNATLEWTSRQPSGAHGGVPVQRWGFQARWR